MILADRREGGLQGSPVETTTGSGLLHSLDRNIPLGIKLIVPVIVVTIAGTAAFGLLLAQQVRQNIEGTGEVNARHLADSAIGAFVAQQTNPSAVSYSLLTIVSDEPDVIGVWIVATDTPGYPVVPLLFALAGMGIVVNIFFTDFRNALAGSVVLALGVPVYLFWRRLNGRRQA